jgi:tyrosyl-tRNA synthetase
MESGISYTEFSYMLVQAYDFWHLFQAEGCELQMGGSDQWGNITAGIELIGRREQKPAHGLVFPLLTTSSGSKFGKSEAGNIWLDLERTDEFKFYQFWFNTEDQDVERFLKLFTFLDLAEIARIVAAHQRDPGSRGAQRRLAEDLTRRVHGEERLRRAVEASEFAFVGKGSIPLKLKVAGTGTVTLPPGIPRKPMAAAKFGDGVSVVDALLWVGLASSKADARRGIQGKGYSLNGIIVTEVDARVSPSDLISDPDGSRYVVLRKGKKNHVVLVIEP